MKSKHQLVLDEVITALQELEEDASLPKNVKDKVQRISLFLQEKTELSLKIDKALQEFDEISDDINLEPFTRTQIWNMVRLLENG